MKIIIYITEYLIPIILKNFYIFILALTFTLTSYSQNFCESSAYSPNKSLIVGNNNHPDYTNYSFCVKIYIHVLQRSDDSGGQSVNNVNIAVQKLNTAFNSKNIYFKWNNNINYIKNTSYYNSPGNVFNTSTYDHSDGIDIYMGDDYANHPISGEGYGLTAGIGASSKFVLTGQHLGLPQYPIVRSFVMAHEMGHVFNLWHTRHGTVIEDIDDDPNQCSELVNGSNGGICGDYIADTPADPGMSNVSDSNCFWPVQLYDANNDLYNPDETNFMGYTHTNCMNYFSDGQFSRMKKALALIPFLQLTTEYITFPGNPCSSLGFKAYPNAADNELHLDLTEKPYALYTYQLYNINGEIVQSGDSYNIIKTLDTSELQNGSYFLHFYEDGEMIIKQIIIQH